MRRREFLQAAAAGVTGAAAFGYSGVSRAAEPARLRRVTVEGDARARGESHGEQLRDEVRGILELWQGFISQISGMEPGDFVAGFLGETKLLSLSSISCWYSNTSSPFLPPVNTIFSIISRFMSIV